MEDIRNLQNRLFLLERENEYLKRLLDQAGIHYAFNMSEAAVMKSDPIGQENCLKTEEITHQHVRKFFSFFWGRMDVYAKRYQNKTNGKAGYATQCNNRWSSGICPKAEKKTIKCKDCRFQSWTHLTPQIIENHLKGFREDASDVIGIYPLFPDGTCRFLVFDFDNHAKGAESRDYANDNDDWKEEVRSLQEICAHYKIPILTERSRSGCGAHIWIFFDSAIEASLARSFGFALLDQGAEAVNMKSFRFYDRMLPAQDTLENGSLGNLIALPLQGQALKYGNSAFVDQQWRVYPDQWKQLLNTERMSKEQVQQLTDQWNSTQEDQLDVDRKPWEKNKAFHKSDVKGSLKIVLSNQIYVDAANLQPRIQNQIRRMASFSNPAFFRNKAMGISNFTNSRFIYLGSDEDGYICIPRGILETLLDRCKEAEIRYEIDDQRSDGDSVSAEFVGELREHQQSAVNHLLKHDCGILNAATAFGKTVTCCGIIASKKVSTLILLESTALIEQWEKALNTFLAIQQEPPEYQTKTGRIKKRKSCIGIIHGSKDTSTGIIDIAMAGSLCKKGAYHPRLKEYGMVLVDECHHSASETLRTVLSEVTAKYVYGVTATPFRGDGLDQINTMLLGPIRFQFTAKEKAKEQGIPHWIVPRFTRAVSPHRREKTHINEAYLLIRNHELRNDQIVQDIRLCVKAGRSPVVLTKYTEHASMLYERVKTFADRVFLLTGKLSKLEQKTMRDALENVRRDESMILIATGQLIGEGFDYPRLDTLIMATPVAWKGVVVQYAGRLNRDYAGKTSVMIYDYIDSHIPVFDRMYTKRLRAYKQIGYQLYSESDGGKQFANAIFDADTYYPVYETDLLEAKKDIVISSPTLGRKKVTRMIEILKKRQELGVKVTVVTWHPDVYQYGREEQRIVLMEELRNAGIHIELMEQHCERYAVIDGEIVWYGSMNLLSKDDIEDNIMRISNRKIAEELLEKTFHKENELMVYQLPL